MKYGLFQYTNCDKQRKVFHVANDIKKNYRMYINPSVVRLLELMGMDAVEVRGEGVYLYDSTGKGYIDCLGGYGAFAFGHRHPRIVEAVKKQLDELPLSGKVFLNRSLASAAHHLAMITPTGLQYSFWCNSGTEAVEGALKTARFATGRTRFIAMSGGFHGKTFGALSVSGRELYRAPFVPMLEEVTHIPFGDVDALKLVIDETVAGVIVEPIQGEGGVVVPPCGYLREVRALCDRYGVLMIADEVQTGMGRTGRTFAVEWEEIVPDILVLAKALGGGVMPCGAFIATEDVWRPYFDYPFIHTSTFGGNPLACTAADMAMTVLIEEGLAENAANMGKYLLERLENLMAEYPELICGVRGRGLLLGLELPSESLAGFLMAELVKRGVLAAYTLNNPTIIRLEPPLIIGQDVIDAVIERLESAFWQMKKCGL